MESGTLHHGYHGATPTMYPTLHTGHTEKQTQRVTPELIHLSRCLQLALSMQQAIIPKELLEPHLELWNRSELILLSFSARFSSNARRKPPPGNKV
jgi:hypothetical protein